MLDTFSGNIRPHNIEDEIKDSFLSYAMSVIVSRALPDVRDRLQTVAHVRQGARDDHAHRVGEEGFLYLVFDGVGPYVPRESVKHPGSSPLWRSPL